MYKLLDFLLVFIISVNAFADDDIITQNMPNSCTIDNLHYIGDTGYLDTVWQPNSYTCAPGYYLLADGISCTQCPIDHDCPGGTYTYSETKIQGIIYNYTLMHNSANTCIKNYLWPTNNQTILDAVWQINSYDCDAGYYLPADGIECELCPENSYCSGGTYTYNETMTQGIMDCPDTLVSPMGMYDIGSCGRKMHIGNELVFMRSQKKTTPSLNIDINNDGIADFFGNLSQTRTVMNRASQHYLHIGEYYLYDDSIKIDE